MRNVGLLLMMLLLIKVVEAQYVSQKDSLDINNARMFVLSNGQIATDTSINPSAGYIIPKQSRKTAIFTMSLWVSGRDAVSMDTHLIANTYGSLYRTMQQYTGEGPVADNYNSSFKNKYGRLWKLNKTEIDHHRNNWFLPFYTLNSTIASWPAHGDTTNGEAYYLAPFIDFNQNGKYDPQNGDYPCIKGDQAVYTISNDDNVDTGKYFFSQFPLEIHLMAYGFANGNILENTTFLDYKIINRGQNAIEQVYVGFFQDADVGCPDDDYVGCDSNLNTFYSYNGQLFDRDCGRTRGYGNSPPIIGATFLNQSMTSYLYYDRGNNKYRGDPKGEKDHYNYLKSNWRDGSHMVYGGNGHPSDPQSTSKKINYMFPSDPRDTLGWTEISSGNAAFDRRGLGATGPFTVQPNESVELSMGIVFTRDSTISRDSIFDLFKSDVTYIRNFYNTNIKYCSYWATGEEEISWKNDVKLFPNPANNVLNIQLPEGDLNLNIEVYDAFGKTVHKSYLPNGIKYEIDVSSWTKAMYFIRIYNTSNAWVEKVMVE